MRDPNRIVRIIKHLRTVWLHNPDMRLGQLLCNITVHGDGDIFYIEDDVIEERLKEQLYTKEGKKK